MGIFYIYTPPNKELSSFAKFEKNSKKKFKKRLADLSAL